MFRTHSPYSPFFTSGLLSQPFTPSPDVPRRGSLPNSRSPSDVATSDASAFYFTLQPRRDEQEFRSFLSLDLAESQSMRSASLKRKASSSTKSPSHAPRHPFRFPPIPEAPALPLPAPTPLRMRFSRDSLRTIPSPKPAPSITLPDLPTKLPHLSTAPRLPSIPVIPALDFTLPPTLSSSPPRTVPQLKLNLVSVWSDNSSKVNRVSVLTTSTVSTRARRNNRSDALARLEGRHARSIPQHFLSVVSPTPSKNFMSMSDDEDSDGDVDEGNHDDDSDDDSDCDGASDLSSFDYNLLTLNPILEPEDCVLPLPLPSPSFLEAPRSAPLPPTRPYSRTKSSTRGGLLSAGNYGKGSSTKKQRTTTTRKASSRKAPTPSSRKGAPCAASEWFPLKSFIDLRNEDTTRTSGSAKGSSTKTGSSSGKSNGRWSTWRSFIEVAHVS